MARSVLLAGTPISDEDFGILEGALAKLNAQLSRVTGAAPGCEPARAPVAPGVRVWVSWQRGEQVLLCFEDATGRHARTLGPFARLHGSAREQLMTVIESGLQAAEAASEELAGREAEAVSPPSGTATPPPPSAAAVGSAAPRLNLAYRSALGFGLTSWSSRALAWHLDAAFGLLWLERSLELRVGARFVPGFEVSGSSRRLELQAQSWRVGLELLQRVPLYTWLAGQISAGAALEHMRVEPRGEPAALQARRSRSHADPLLFARLGPSFALGAYFELSIQVGAELLLYPRRYGFTVGDTNQVVLDLSRVRASALVEISATL